jgi:hypothetical protein
MLPFDGCKGYNGGVSEPTQQELEDAVRFIADQLGLAPGEEMGIALDDHYPGTYSGGYSVKRTDGGDPATGDPTYAIDRTY